MNDTQAVLSVLEETDVFAGIDKGDIQALLSSPEVKKVVFSKGQYIYHHGDKSENFWIILSGELVSQTSSLRHPFHRLSYFPGDITGLRGVVDQGQPRPVSLIADSESELIEIPGSVLLGMDSKVWGVVVKNIARIVLNRLIECHEREDH
ncbi:MAG: cyclic nucleotide-binding domain-containing protein [Magnetococcales bacterium]|nr:cyclic nucleotide-binding domain-containing protein [Magnetococcales bacterium]